MNQKLIDALVTERNGYVQRGLKDRVAQIDALLKQLDHRVDTPVIETASADPVVEKAAKPRARKRNDD